VSGKRAATRGSSLHARESAYLAELCRRTKACLGPDLVGAYAGGSYALGDYLPGRSDLDVAVVVQGALASPVADSLVDAVRHESLPCPARGLELVVYSRARAQSGTVEAGFELNLNSGREMPFRVEREAGAERHWFPIDRSILSQAGIALAGPPASSVFAPIPRSELLPVLAESVRWHRRHREHSDDAVLNACRGLAFARLGRWLSKPGAGRWAIAEDLDAAGTVARALAIRDGEGELDGPSADGFLTEVERLLGDEGRRRG
jgi:predicted nucleotidyltransferase